MNSQIADFMSISARTVRRILNINPDHICVDGSQTTEREKLLDPYKNEIKEFIELGYKNCQILSKLKAAHPQANIKRSTLGNFCLKLKDELYEYTKDPTASAPKVNEGSVLAPYTEKIYKLIADGKAVNAIYSEIKSDGYLGSYSLLQQYCFKFKGKIHTVKRNIKKIKRKHLTDAIWSENHDLSEECMRYIETHFPVISEIKDIISEFRVAYTNKDIDAVKAWCKKNISCKFPMICSFINGINTDNDAFYNSMKYEYNNGLLEGSVNKLKAVKRSMFGRAGYKLLRAKLILENAV